ncbi:hypothetical protein SAMN05877962_108105 [Alloalcanivorax xenomutans]|nr:hypothetical protein SAMN05877962_108105 [Alloalcanivorax xenomutans]
MTSRSFCPLFLSWFTTVHSKIQGLKGNRLILLPRSREAQRLSKLHWLFRQESADVRSFPLVPCKSMIPLLASICNGLHAFL